MADAHIIAAADQEQAELRLTLQSLIASAAKFEGSEETRLWTTYLALRMVFTAYEDMSVAAAELMDMIVQAKAGEQP